MGYTITSFPDKTVEVLKSDHTTGDVVIPATVGYNGVDFTVTRIADNAFEYCHNITNFTIPNTITSIGKLGFGWCWYLHTIILDNPNSDFTCGSYAFDYDWRAFKNVNIINIDKKSVLENGAGIIAHLPAHDLYIEGKRITDFDVPEGTQKINTFFKNAMSLKRITFASEVQSVVDNAFYHCDSLHTVYLSPNLTKIGNSAFDECASLRTIYSPSFNPAEAQISSFPNGAYMFATVYIPKGTLSLYKSAKGWEKFENYIETDELGIYTGDEVYYTLNLNVNSTGMGTVTGSGTYKKDSAATITAIANTGYEFSQWSDGNTDNPRQITMTENLTLTATFRVIPQAKTYIIHVNQDCTGYMEEQQ
ncbi:MAG: leucine-rich repeat protein [Paludibacteraceae bacterium]|nr:leucine-rich repeat protein [Paludibacteraceae bacterium]